MRVQCGGQDERVWRVRLQPDEDGGDIVFTAPGFDELADALGAAERSNRCRMVVLEGSGGAFCRGMDLEALVADPDTHAKKGTAQYAACLLALRGSSKVVVSLVDGDVTAGGVGLAVAADWLVATESSTFGLPEPIVGMVPAMVVPLLLERMCEQKVRRFVLGGTALGAGEAAQLGMVDQVVPTAAQFDHALRMIAKQVLRLEPGAVARLKALSGEMATMGWAEAVGVGRTCTAEMLSQPDRIRGIADFVAGEPLPWFERYRPTGGTT